MVAFVTLTTTSMAQERQDRERPAGRPSKEQMVQMQTERMTKELDLDDAQKAKVLELNNKYSDAIRFNRPPRGEGGPNGRFQPRGNDNVNGDRPARDGERRMGGGNGNQRPDPEQMKAMQQQREEYEKELSKILTPDQMTKYKEMRQNQGQRMRRNNQ